MPFDPLSTIQAVSTMLTELFKFWQTPAGQEQLKAMNNDWAKVGEFLKGAWSDMKQLGKK